MKKLKKRVLWKNKDNWISFLEKGSLSSPWPNKRGVKNHAITRQAKTASLILASYQARNPGVILADDVGLGKTWVAVLVAIAVASAEGKVVISVPNQTMREKWSEEFERWYGDDPHPGLFERGRLPGEWNKLHPGSGISWVRFRAERANLATGEGTNLATGKIMLVTHTEFFNRKTPWKCNLLIVDEAHRGLDRLEKVNYQHTAKFVVLLTATPFGKDPAKLLSMLKAVGCTEERVVANVKKYATARIKPEQQSPQELARLLTDCEIGLKPWLIRHSFESVSTAEAAMLGKDPIHVLGDLPSPGEFEEAPGSTLPRKPIPIEDDETRRLIIHTERLHTLVRQRGVEDGGLGSGRGNVQTLVAPYARGAVKNWLDWLKDHKFDKSDAAILYHYDQLNRIVASDRLGPMEQKLRKFAECCFKQGEKFVVFCAHHTTRKAVMDVLKLASEDTKLWKTEETQVHWKEWCKTVSEISSGNAAANPPIEQLNFPVGQTPKVNEWNELFTVLKRRERSLRRLSGVGKETAPDRSDDQEDLKVNEALSIPAVADLQEGSSAWLYRILFNSPFHPQALVLTAKDSEGIDLHRNCRLLVHYELPYRPEALLQANGRIRRLNSLASREETSPIYFYPYLAGTRSERLTQVVVDRVEQFRRMMGGVPQLSLDAPTAMTSSTKDSTKRPDFSNKTFANTLKNMDI